MKLHEAYGILSAVYRDGAYASVLLGKGVDPFTEELVNLVLERHYFYNACVDAASKNSPRPKARLILTMGFAMLDKMRKPAYAVTDSCVALAKELKLFETGYINACLKRFADGERPILTGKTKEEAELNLPTEMIRLIKADYPKAYRTILTANAEFRKKHFRLRSGVSESVLDSVLLEKTEYGYYAQPSPLLQSLFQEGKITYQSLASLHAVAAVGAEKGDKILDLCAAPGGKSVAMAETGAEVTAAELYPHRAELIRSYAGRMNVPVQIAVADGTVFRPEWKEKFDKVLVDAPCSGLGVLSKRKDMFLRRSAADVDALCALQSELLHNASRYVKKGGILVYSTCTVLKRENSVQARAFLEQHTDFRFEALPEKFENKGEAQFLPDGKGMDGFYVARFRKL